MSDISQTFAETVATIQRSSFQPRKPHRWTRKNAPQQLPLVLDWTGTPVIPRDNLVFLLNASPAVIQAWRLDPGFPEERRYNAHINAVGYAPGELIVFLETLPHEDQARVCPALPLGAVNALRSGPGLRVRRLTFQPTLKELLVAGGVTIVTATILFFGIMAAAG
jgi:hypothetical protein